MELLLRRTHKLPFATTGILYDGDHMLCFIAEDAVRAPGVKIPGETAIPAGRYEITVTWSDRFQRRLPLLLRIPMFDGVRIHPGNSNVDTLGCLLPGKTRDAVAGTVQLSLAAFKELFERIDTALLTGKVFITIE